MTYTTEYDAQRDAIVAAVRSVTDAGRVHNRPRLGDFRTRWTTTINGREEVRSWELSSDPVEVIRREQGRRHRYRTWILRGVHAIEDRSPDDSSSQGDTDNNASYHTINRLAGEIADAIDATRDANVAAGTFIDQDPTQIEEPTVVQIGGGPIAWGVTLTVRGYTILTP